MVFEVGVCEDRGQKPRHLFLITTQLLRHNTASSWHLDICPQHLVFATTQLPSFPIYNSSTLIHKYINRGPA